MKSKNMENTLPEKLKLKKKRQELQAKIQNYLGKKSKCPEKF